MTSRFRRRWVESPALIVVFVLFVCGAGTALAASGVGSLVANGEDGAVSERGAQQPLASGRTGGFGGNVTPGDTGPGVAGDTGEGSAGEVLGNNNSGTVSAGSGSKLPFTGFLAIPLLLLGAGMLVGGVALRRRSPQPA